MPADSSSSTSPWPTRVSPSGALVMSALPGLLLMVVAGRATWAEFEPIVRAGHAEPILGPRYTILNRVVSTDVRDVPDDEFRRQVGGLINDYVERLDGFGYVVDTDGFLAAITRAVITGIATFARMPFPTQTFKHAEAAAHWAISTTSTSITAPELVAELDRLATIAQAART